MSHVSRTMKLYRDRVVPIGIVERFIHRPEEEHGIKSDLFGIFDLVAIEKDHLVGIQVCGSDYQSHVRKIQDSFFAIPWLNAGAGIILYSWRKVKQKRGGKAAIWEPRVKIFTLNDFGKENSDDTA